MGTWLMFNGKPFNGLLSWYLAVVTMVNIGTLWNDFQEKFRLHTNLFKVFLIGHIGAH